MDFIVNLEIKVSNVYIYIYQPIHTLCHQNTPKKGYIQFYLPSLGITLAIRS